MELGKNWGAVDPSKLETFQQLGLREQNAVRVALDGISKWQETKLPPKPMKVSITDGNSFDLRGFAGVLHELKVGISDSLVRDEQDPNTVTFQPRPYSRTFLPKTDIDRLDAMRETVKSELDGLPPELRKLFEGFGYR